MNLNIVELEQNIINTINNSGVNIATVCLILDKINREANQLLQKTIEEEKEKREQTESMPITPDMIDPK